MKRFEFKGTKGKWSEGKQIGTVVSDFVPYSRPIDDDTIEYYGGFPIAESISSKNDVQLITAAPDLLNAILYYFDVLKEVRGIKWAENDHVLKKMLEAVKKALNVVDETTEII